MSELFLVTVEFIGNYMEYIQPDECAPQGWWKEHASGSTIDVDPKQAERLERAGVAKVVTGGKV